MKTIQDNHIVAYTEGETFSSEQLKQVDKKLRTYLFVYGSEQMEVKAINIEIAKKALGCGLAYESEWGDFRYFVEGIKSGDVVCYEKRVNYTEVEL